MAPQQFAVGTLGQFSDPDTVFIGLYMFSTQCGYDTCGHNKVIVPQRVKHLLNI